ncbi:MAG TPA: hypothetical protein VFZ27_02875 [Terriglobia bacterium]|nr:hypothetical protein [Terriglobia bacterium]
MLPAEIKAEQFKGYPPQAREVAVDHLDLFRQLPLAFAALILQQLEQYDWKFPAERREIDHQLSYLSSRSGPEMASLLSEFEQLKLSRDLEQFNWVDAPGTFSQQLSAYLWATHQIDSFRGAAEKLMEKVNASMPPEQLPAPRLGIMIVGKEVKESQYPLFRKLRPYGTHFTRVDPSNGLRILLDAAAARAKEYPAPFGHWYIDGGPAEAISETTLISISYSALEPVRKAILQKITRAINGGIGGPEALTSMLFKLRPEQVGLSGKPEDEIIGHLETSIFTQGQGTQIFSTTFVQWTAREVLRRAHPLTLVARFAPRQRQRPMNELLSGKDFNPEPDPMGSLIDADMGAFLTWIDQQRLSGANQSSFLAWFEDHNEAVAISPFLPHNTESDTAIDMNGLLTQMGLKTTAGRMFPRQKVMQSSAVNPARDNFVLDRVDNNVDSVDFLNGVDFGDTT